jgi:hypothetical protein
MIKMLLPKLSPHSIYMFEYNKPAIFWCPLCGAQNVFKSVSPACCVYCELDLPNFPAILNNREIRVKWHKTGRNECTMR